MAAFPFDKRGDVAESMLPKGLNERSTSLLGITMGDPAGVGPEIIVDGWRSICSRGAERAVVYGHPELLRRAAKLRKVSLEVVPIESLSDIPESPEVLPCLPCVADEVLDVPPGVIDARAGEAAFRALSTAIDDALEGRIGAIVTAPLHKAALHRAGHRYPGHTEILAERCGVEDFAMMLYLGPEPPLEGKHGLAVVHVTLHTAMRNVFEEITPETVLAKIKLAHRFMRRMGNDSPSIGVCSLNPHAGESGLFGEEETTCIRPAVKTAQSQGWLVEGPLPADTIMVEAVSGRYDAVVAMFHDQGHIALKLLGMHRAVNVTLGLPIIRTSVAHGTAFDRAWKGVARSSSLLEAVRVARLLAAPPE
jgi:4-hydroxythreonine-4-phosphate dehydrogenase